MKNYKNRMVTEKQATTRRLRCVNAQDVMGIGSFKQGDEITDPRTIEHLAGGDHPNPNFVEVKED